ncbi:hypothetical protein DFJ58DRAFT_731384 [Suillus subalutaceus]|uniref:uncharacterized protein n=1 Tax=Suillus subalutaceus TaxID=48586 RepID=UPI001B869EDE|nr:uncharacterized protein DFJ58DRAFT_731384 [Suillus subalutaceus]KAG1844080.1 hypothetical protein DFJ58DRAFT_731384 [Suillus subalutaceus]
MTEDQAIIVLRNIWQAENNDVKAQWQAQLDEDRDRQEHLERLNEDEQERQEQECHDKEEATLKEDKKKKKKKYKYTAVPNLNVPMNPTILPLDDAKLKSSVDEDTMIMATLAGGDTAWVSATSMRNAKAVIDDQNLNFEDFCQACPHIIDAMQEAAWPADRIQMMAKFWCNLQVHNFRSMHDPLAQKALVIYHIPGYRSEDPDLRSNPDPMDISVVRFTDPI